VREAVEILIRGHGEALSALAGVTEADAADYRAYPQDVAPWRTSTAIDSRRSSEGLPRSPGSISYAIPE